ncbi:unnamed protein product, partial [Darwinula stevensoni]
MRFLLLAVSLFSPTSSSAAAASLKGVVCTETLSWESALNGSITSPNYPRPYEKDTECVYRLLGAPQHRIRLVFTHFKLPQPQSTTVNGESSEGPCHASDRVRIFVRSRQKPEGEALEDLCGDRLPKAFMSPGNTMTLLFNGHRSGPHIHGFQAFYEFLTDFGMSSGEQVIRDGFPICEFVFNGSREKYGRIASPNYPGLYPRTTTCRYLFYGRPGEYVSLQFKYFDVEGIPPCLDSTASDFVEFSNFISSDRGIPRHCGNKKPEVLTSEGTFFRVTFFSNDKFDATGFQADFQFQKISQAQQQSVPIRKVRPMTFPAASSFPSPSTQAPLHVQCACLVVLLTMDILQDLMKDYKDGNRTKVLWNVMQLLIDATGTSIPVNKKMLENICKDNHRAVIVELERRILELVLEEFYTDDHLWALFKSYHASAKVSLLYLSYKCPLPVAVKSLHVLHASYRRDHKNLSEIDLDNIFQLTMHECTEVVEAVAAILVSFLRDWTKGTPGDLQILLRLIAVFNKYRLNPSMLVPYLIPDVGELRNWQTWTIVLDCIDQSENPSQVLIATMTLKSVVKLICLDGENQDSVSYKKQY